MKMDEEFRKKILLVDTDASRSVEFRSFLESGGYSARGAANYQEALTSVQNWKPDLVILNLLVQSFSPLDFITEVRQNPFTESQKMIMLSRMPRADMVAGPVPRVKACLGKPVDFDALKSALLKAAPKPDKARPVKVLVADDDEEFSELVRTFLEEAGGYRPIVINDPLKILDAIRSERPQALLLDMMMPKKDGFQIMDEMQDEAATAAIPIIVLSAMRFDNFQERGVMAGLPKTISRDLPKNMLLDLIAGEIGDSPAPVAVDAVNPPRPKVLIADDQTELLLLLKETLEGAGFEVFTASDGREALRTIFETRPDIAVLDYSMPAKDGLAVAAEMKNNPLFAHIPIIICTAFGEKKTRIKGLGMGIDDYLIKPVDTDELIARIRMILKRNKLVLDANPLSKLPGNPSIQTRIESELQKGSVFAVLYLDLNNFKAYNDSYGFEAGDRVIKATANLLVKLAIEDENSRDFVGHIGGDDFIIVTAFEKAEELAGRIAAGFDEVAPSFYKKADRERGCIVSTDRQGVVKKFPFLSLAVGIVHNKLRPLKSFAQISAIGTDLKKAAKASGKSACVIDRRKD